MENIFVDGQDQNRIFGLNKKRYDWRKENTEFQHKNLTPSVKHAGGSIMVWACFAACGLYDLPSLTEQLILNYTSEF